MRNGNTVQNAPKLLLDKALYEGQNVPPHVVRERRIVWNLFLHLLQNGGWTVDSVNDGDTDTRTRSAKAAMELIFNLDEAYVFLSNTKTENKAHYIYLVLGNDIDVVSDWSFTEGDPDGFNAAMDKFDAEAFA